MSNLKIEHFNGPSTEALLFWDDNVPNKAVIDIEAFDFVQARKDSAEKYRPESEFAAKKYCHSTSVQNLNGCRNLHIEPKNLTNTKQVGIFLFGGGFIEGSPESDLRLSAPLASKLGMAILSPYYRLAPEHPFPTALDDCLAFYKAAIAQYGAENIVLMGESAGANLAMATLLKAHANDLAMPQAVALLSPVTDQSGDPYNASNFYQDDPSLAPAVIDLVQQVYAPNSPNNDPLVSPHLGDFGTWCPPLLFTTGTRDVFQFQVQKSAEKIASSGVNVTVHSYEGMWHVFEYYPQLPEAPASISRIADFLRSHLEQSSE